MDKMNDLRMCLLNDLRGIELEEHGDLEGFIIRDAETGEALYTAYCADPGFSSFVAINDIWKGIECADEKALAVNVPLFTAVAKIKTDHRAHSTNYPRWVEAVCWQGGFYE